MPKFFTFSSGKVAGISGVQIGPGATLFTRIPRSPSIPARLAAKFAIAAFVAAYGASVGDGISEFTEELPMIDDPGRMCDLSRGEQCAGQHDGVVLHVRVLGTRGPHRLPRADDAVFLAREWEQLRCSPAGSLEGMVSVIGHLIAVVNSHGVGNHDP